MGTTLEKIQAAQSSKEACYEAIEDKGGTVIEGMPFADYADAIRSIPQNEIPETTFIASDLRNGLKAVANQGGTAVQVTGTMPLASGMSVTPNTSSVAVSLSTAGYASGTVGNINYADGFINNSSGDVYCGTAGYLKSGFVYGVNYASGFFVATDDEYAIVGFANAGWVTNTQTFEIPYATFTARTASGYSVIATAGYVPLGATVTHIDDAQFYNAEDGNINCSTAGYCRTGSVLAMEEAGGMYINESSVSVDVMFSTAGWAGTYSQFSISDFASFSLNTPTYDTSNHANVVCTSSGWTKSGSTVSTIYGATMSMDYSGGTVFSGEGYANNNTLVLDTSTMTASGATVYATQGWQNGTQYAEVQTGTVTETDSAIEISEGYVQAGTYSKGGGGYPAPSGNWSTMTNQQTYYAGEHGAFVKVDPQDIAWEVGDFFMIYVNGTTTHGISFYRNGSPTFTNIQFYIPPYANFSIAASWGGSSYNTRSFYCDAILQS